MAIVFSLAVISSQPAQGQTFKVLHTFTGGADGGMPYATLVMDHAGNLYGTTLVGGIGYGNGVVFKLSKHGSDWILTPIYAFYGGTDGGNPYAGVVFGPDGNLYGTTFEGGDSSCGCGTVFKLSPTRQTPPNTRGGWAETVLYSFQGGSDASSPELADLIFDQSGNIYGTTYYGGSYGAGAVFKLTTSTNGWTESLVYSFTGGRDGMGPMSSVIFDQAGSLYGTTEYGGAYDGGTVFQLAPSGSGWTENTVHSFLAANDGALPCGGLIFDRTGNVYGSTTSGGAGHGGTVVELTPSDGNWTDTVLYAFTGHTFFVGPWSNLVMDAAGNLYGTTQSDGAYGYGNVFKLTPSGGSWTYTSLYDFTAGADGANPYGGVTLDANGNLYGTTIGGFSGGGTAWEITP
jgi:uncharacterized repeat protein (TIGR03803 family)